MKNVFYRTMAWLLIIAMVLGSNTGLVLAEEITEEFAQAPYAVLEVGEETEISETPTEEETEVPTEMPLEQTAQTPIEETTAPPVEPETAVAIEETTTPMVEPAEEITEAPTEEPTEESTEAPTEEPTEATEACQEYGFISGLVCVFVGSTVYDRVSGIALGRFTANATAYGEAVCDAMDWVKLCFDTAENRSSGQPVLEGYVQLKDLTVLNSAEAHTRNVAASGETDARMAGGYYLSVSQFEAYANVGQTVPVEEPTEVPIEKTGGYLRLLQDTQLYSAADLAAETRMGILAAGSVVYAQAEDSVYQVSFNTGDGNTLGGYIPVNSIFFLSAEEEAALNMEGARIIFSALPPENAVVNVDNKSGTEGSVMDHTLPETVEDPVPVPVIESVRQVSADSALLHLQVVPNADGYEIECAYEEDGSFSLLKTVSDTSSLNTGLAKGADYYYRVRAFVMGEDGEAAYSEYSPVFHLYMYTKFLDAPDNAAVRQISANAAKITWDEVEGAEGYLVYRSMNGGAFRQLRDTPLNETTNTALPEKGVFSYKVTAYFTENGQRILSAESRTVELDILPIGTPEITEITQPTASGIRITWSAVKGAAGYKLYKSGTENGSYVWAKNVFGTNSTTYSSGVQAGEQYYFVVRAFAEQEDGSITLGAASPAVSFRLEYIAQVGGLKLLQTGSNKVRASWNTVAGVDGYEVWVSGADRNSYVLQAVVTGNTVELENLNDGVTCYCKVRAFKNGENATDYGLFSMEASAEVIAAPKLRTAEQSADTEVRLTWTRVDSADGYEIWAKDGSGVYRLMQATASQSAQVTGFLEGQEYSIKVRAYRNADSGQKKYGVYSNIMRVFVLGQSKITSLTTSSGTGVTLYWTKAEGASGYNLYRSDDLNGPYVRIKSTTTLTITNTGLTKGSRYFFKIVPYRTVNGVNVQGFATEAKGIRLLEKPVIRSIEQTGAEALKLTWSKIPQASSYQVFWSDTPTGEFKLLAKVDGGENTSVTADNLTQRQWYCYTVEAVLDEGDTYSVSQRSVVREAYVTDLKKSEISTLVQMGETSVKVTSGKVSGASGYEFSRATDPGGPYTVMRVQPANSFTDVDLTPGVTYYYRSRPYKTVDGKKVFGMVSQELGALVMPAATIYALDRTMMNRVELYWDSVPNATGYKLYRSGTVDGKYSLLKTVTENTAYNAALTLESEYYYRVRPIISDGLVMNDGPLSEPVGIWLSEIGGTSMTRIRQNGNHVELKWKPVSGAQGYEVFMAGEGDKTFTKMKETDTADTVVSVNAQGGCFRYRVRAYAEVDGERQYGPVCATASIYLMQTPTLDFAYQTQNTKVMLDWTDVPFAQGYEVYRRTVSGTYEKIKDIPESNVSNSGLTVGMVYFYKVRAYRIVNGVKSVTEFTEEKTITPIRYTVGTFPESEHNYRSNSDLSWSYTIKGAQNLVAVFSQNTCFELNQDKLYITDRNGNAVEKAFWTGNELAGKMMVIPGDTINLRMTTDMALEYYGFSFDLIAPYNDQLPAPKYRALLIGETAYSPILEGPDNDVACIASILQGLPDPYEVIVQENATCNEIVSLIDIAYAGATENDISLFHFSGHGVVNSDDYYTGALLTTDGGCITTTDLAQLLSKVPGQVIVILDSCGSGAAIWDGYSGQAGNEEYRMDIDAFNNGVIDAFSAFDSIVSEQTGLLPKTGELRKTKFHVITGCGYKELSFTMNDGVWGGILSRSVAYSAGCGFPGGAYQGSMPADLNKDNALSFIELADSCRDYASSYQNVRSYSASPQSIVLRRAN